MLDLTYILRGYEISNTAMLVYGVLWGLSEASAKRGKDYTYISRASIAARVGKCERTARKAVKELEAVGLISIKRMGRGLNDRIFVFDPKTQEAEKAANVEGADLSVCRSKTAKVAALNINTEKVNNNTIDISINPISDKEAAKPQDNGFTAAKGRPTNKRPCSNIAERKKIRKAYREYFRNSLNFEEYEHDIFITYEDKEALSKIIDLMANTMSCKRQIYVNGALITPQQWYYVVKSISQEQVLNIIAKIPKFENVRKPQAYILSCLYNAALHEALIKPWLNNRDII